MQLETCNPQLETTALSRGFTLQNQPPSAITAQELLSASLGLPEPAEGPGITEEQFIQQLADAVDYWMQHRMEQLMSLCYTLDVSEAAVAEAFHPSAPEAANIGLARLLYQRQCRRLETKQQFKPETLDDEDAW
ncbi:hypothetical protein [Neolewinella agarilytica]|uniref:hypothetical protein n=1 Tax=Neolewinella agarilytica TaxID=478744 RepID=UPI0023522BC5|nr:hypothetical protein [Neolewinella agarilytica]